MAVGDIVWHDLTIDDATEVRDFYKTVIGWEHDDHSMGDYNDYVLHPAGGSNTAVGVCHRRGPNAGMPAQWMIYVQVEDVAESCKRAVHEGGDVIEGPRDMGGKAFAVIRDPAGAVLAIIE